MEIGLDYMQMRSRAQHYGLRWTGIGLLLAGMVLVGIGLAYYGNLYWLRSGVENYAAQREDATLLNEVTTPKGVKNGAVVSAYALPAGAYAETVEELGFTPLNQSDAEPLGTLAPAQRVIVPKLGINVTMNQISLTGASIVKELAGIDPAEYEAVQANPGERGAMWLFGAAGKGADAFGGLNNAAGLLTKGNDLLIYVNSGTQIYLYGATHTDVIPADDLRLSSTDRATIHLAVPTPPGLYDHFLVLTGELVGVK